MPFDLVGFFVIVVIVGGVILIIFVIIIINIARLWLLGSAAMCGRPALVLRLSGFHLCLLGVLSCRSGLVLNTRVLNTRVLFGILVDTTVDDQLLSMLVNAFTARICAVAATIATAAVPAEVFGRSVIIAVGVV